MKDSFAPQKENYCVCSVLQSIFYDYGLEIPQDEIADNLTSTKDIGSFLVDDLKINEFMKSKGFNYNFYWWNETPFNEPDTLLEEMSENYGFIGMDDHVYRLLNFKHPNVRIINLNNSHKENHDYYKLMCKIRESDGGFGLVKKLD